MVVSYPEEEGSRGQHNYGPGTFIGGDNYGNIENLDKATKAILEKLSREAPALGKLLSEALQKGIVSPEAVFALELAARSINEEVANSLRMAGQNINADVAGRLFAASQTLEEAASKFKDIEERLDPSFGMGLIDRLDAAAQRVGNETERIEQVFEPPPPEIIINWKVTAWAFVAGVIL
jgi:hypothetical protein